VTQTFGIIAAGLLHIFYVCLQNFEIGIPNVLNANWSIGLSNFGNWFCEEHNEELAR
jgi:hypothetical protein